MKPQLLPKDNPNLDTLTYPVLVSPKLDGIRCLTTTNGPVSRTLKRIPNNYIFETLSKLPPGFDGELIVGNPYAEDCYRKTSSAVMSFEGEPDFTYWVFDRWDLKDTPFKDRFESLYKNLNPCPFNKIEILSHIQVSHKENLEAYFLKEIDYGGEGLIVRNPKGLYKYGRCTAKENNAFKYKPYADDEAVIVSYECEYENTNEVKVNELGRSSRAINKAGLLAKESLGSITVCNEKWGYFNIGTGFTKEEREELWKDPLKLLNKAVKFKYFPVGIKDKPRHPVFLGFRDMSIDG